MERRQLEYFLAIVDYGGVTRAANHLHVAQPTISAALRTLEKELGGQLFERAPRRFLLTSAGQALLEPARQILRDFDSATESVHDVLGLGGGHLDIGTNPAVVPGWLTTVLAGYRRQHPAVRVRVFTDTDDQSITDGVRSGQYNFGLTVSHNAEKGFTTHQVGVQDLRALLPPETVEVDEPVDIDTLADMDLITLHRGNSTSRQWLEGELGKRGKTPRIRMELSTTDGILPLVESGAGYALWWAPLTSGTCVLQRIQPPLQRPIFLLLRDGPLPPATSAFLQIVESQEGIGRYGTI